MPLGATFLKVHVPREIFRDHVASPLCKSKEKSRQNVGDYVVLTPSLLDFEGIFVKAQIYRLTLKSKTDRVVKDF